MEWELSYNKYNSDEDDDIFRINELFDEKKDFNINNIDIDIDKILEYNIKIIRKF